MHPMTIPDIVDRQPAVIVRREHESHRIGPKPVEPVRGMTTIDTSAVERVVTVARCTAVPPGDGMAERDGGTGPLRACQSSVKSSGS